MCVCVYLLAKLSWEREKSIYYNELAYANMEAKKSQVLYLANWRPRKANGMIPVQKPAVPQRQEKTRVKYSQKGQPFCSIQALNWLD